MFALAYFTIAGILVSGIGVFVYQIYTYLKIGKWSSITVVDGLVELGISWANHPTDWKGAWNILENTPLSLFLILTSIGIFYFIVSIAEE